MSTFRLEVPSPCVNVCELDDNKVCQGCLRTIDEIVLWARLNNHEKRLVWHRIEQRRQALGQPPSSGDV